MYMGERKKITAVFSKTAKRFTHCPICVHVKLTAIDMLNCLQHKLPIFDFSVNKSKTNVFIILRHKSNNRQINCVSVLNDDSYIASRASTLYITLYLHVCIYLFMGFFCCIFLNNSTPEPYDT